MTYEPWDAHDRNNLKTPVAITFLQANPWLAPYDFSPSGGTPKLDLGCGAGPASALFAAAGTAVVAVDLTAIAARLTIAHSPGVVAQADAQSLPFRDATFGRVFTWGVLHHTEDFEVAVGEVSRVLKADGALLLMVYHRRSIRYYLKGLHRLIMKGDLFRGETLATVQRFYTDGYFHRHFTVTELRQILGHHGFAIEAVDITHMNRPFAPWHWLDAAIKRRWGWLLVIRARKRLAASSTWA